MKYFKLLLICFLLVSQASAETYSEFSERLKNETEIIKNDGLGLMISGGLALLGGGYGWSAAKKPIEKGFYSIAQTLGLLAIGYGAESYFLKQDEEIFLQVLNSSDISEAQKNRMVQSYLKEKQDRAEDARWIRRASSGLGGIINLVYASQSKDQTLKSFLYIAAGIQFTWAFSF